MSLLYDDLPLRQPDKQLRLLRFDPEHEHSFSLTVHDSEAVSDKYIAISYTWGDTVPTLPILVNGYSVNVRLNCWYALWQVRQQDYAYPVWIDSICINQSDSEEKGCQVAMMGDIFHGAEFVAACLGSENFPPSVLDPREGRKVLKSREARKNFSKALDRLSMVKYFDRLWIIQEVILAKNVILLSGREHLPWEEVGDFILEMEFRHSGNKIAQLHKDRQSRIPLHSPQSTEDVVTSDLFDLLEKYGDSECQDPRDKVYAMLSLLPQDSLARKEIIVSYSQSIFTLFQSLVALLRTDVSLNKASFDKFILVRDLLDIECSDRETWELTHSGPFISSRQDAEQQHVSYGFREVKLLHKFNMYSPVTPIMVEDKFLFRGEEEEVTEDSDELRRLLGDNEHLDEFKMVCWSRGRSYLLVSNHIEVDDIIIDLPFQIQAKEDFRDFRAVFRAAFRGVFRPIGSSTFRLHSWALELSKYRFILNESQENGSIEGTAHIHFDDLLAVALRERYPLQVLSKPLIASSRSSKVTFTDEAVEKILENSLARSWENATPKKSLLHLLRKIASRRRDTKYS